MPGNDFDRDDWPGGDPGEKVNAVFRELAFRPEGADPLTVAEHLGATSLQPTPPDVEDGTIAS